MDAISAAPGNAAPRPPVPCAMAELKIAVWCHDPHPNRRNRHQTAITLTGPATAPAPLGIRPADDRTERLAVAVLVAVADGTAPTGS
ncbi:hypothetical protein Cci01nite_61500 [Catellatospora citrea]|uniref:Uncharacterized protein n=1 Tax=Catellatospora citrea TaxID=53366 RepID=A0A8J3KJL9_9ACTN|nr:hypothetical protein Cci01nite_61500 [Catellatospora citrea]